MNALSRWLRRAPRVGRARVVLRDDPQPVATVVGLHGYGADERQLATLLPITPNVPVRYLAPRAPHPVHGGGYGWFPITVSASGPRIHPTSLAAACAMLFDWIDRHDQGLPVVLIGYSQGGSMAMEMALRGGERFAAIASVAGALSRPSSGVLVRDRPAFLGHGRRDPLIDAARFARDAQALRRCGWRVCAQTDNIGHVVSAAQRRDLTAWLNDSLVRFGHSPWSTPCPPLN